MKKARMMLLLCVASMMLTALCGCAGGKAGSDSSIVVGIPQDLEDSLDPHKAVAAGTKEVLFNIFQGLLVPDSQGNIVPAVAKEYSVSDDKLTYTFVLREGVKFHDGSPVTAEDVKYSIEKSAGMTGSDSLIAAFSNIKEVNIIDEKTVDIVLSEIDVDFPTYVANMNACIIPKSNTTPDTNPIGTGPYMYVSRSPQENIVLKRFDSYWGEAAHIENVTFKIIPDVDSIVMNLNGGAVDMYAHLTTTQVSQLSDEFAKLEGTMNLVQAVYLNNAVKPFDDERVRKALCLACDVQNMLDLTSDGKGTPIGSSMFPAFGKYYTDLSGTYKTNIDEAKKLLKEAGYADGFTFTIKVPSNYQPHIDTALVISQQWKEIGVNAEIQLIEWNSWLSDVYSGRDFEATVVGLDASSLTARALLERFNSDSPKNFINFFDSNYDALYQQAIKETDDEKQVALYKEMEQILADRAANVYLQDMAEFVALNNKFGGYEFYPLYVQDIAKLYIVEK